jgi:pimeloyl-ACP methyl ester carboxylesterase
LYSRFYPGPEAAAATVLCLHGLTRNSRDFEDLAPHLQQRYRVIVPDLRGRGCRRAIRQLKNYQPAIYLKDIVALLASARFAARGRHRDLAGRNARDDAGYQVSRPRITGIVLNDIGPELDPAGIERIKQYAGRLPPPEELGRSQFPATKWE